VADAGRIAEGSTGGVILLAVVPHGRELEYVNDLIAGSRGPWSVVVLQAGEAHWRFAVDASGDVETGLLLLQARIRV
jgi:hypothetical protein